jgi:integrase
MLRRKRQDTDPSIPGEPKYRLHKRSGQAVVTLSGRDHYCGAYGSALSAERYRAVVSEWVARGRRSAEPDAVPLSVAELILEYVQDREAYFTKSDGTPNEKELFHVLKALSPLRELFGATAARDFGPRKLELVRERHVAHGYTRSMVNRYIRRAKHLFKWAAARELVSPTVWQAVSALDGLRRGHTPAREPKPIRAVPDGLVDAIKPHVSRQVWALIEFQRYTGCRPGEAVLLRAVDLDTSGPVWLYKPQHHKTEYAGKERVIALGPRAQAVVREFLKPDVGAYLFSPADAIQEHRDMLHARRKTPLSCGNRPGTNRKARPQKSPGARYTPDSYRRAITEACRKAFPVPTDLTGADAKQWQHGHEWAPNQLRHSFATHVRRDFGLDAAQVALGHSSADVTQIYAEKNLALAAQVALKIG